MKERQIVFASITSTYEGELLPIVDKLSTILEESWRAMTPPYAWNGDGNQQFAGITEPTDCLHVCFEVDTSSCFARVDFPAAVDSGIWDTERYGVRSFGNEAFRVWERGVFHKGNADFEIIGCITLSEQIAFFTLQLQQDRNIPKLVRLPRVRLFKPHLLK